MTKNNKKLIKELRKVVVDLVESNDDFFSSLLYILHDLDNDYDVDDVVDELNDIINAYQYDKNPWRDQMKTLLNVVEDAS